MKKIIISISLGLMVVSATACTNNDTSKDATTATTNDSLNKDKDKGTLTKEQEMAKDAKAAAESTCKALQMFPKVITDDTKPNKEAELAANEANEMRAVMEKKYTVASGDWAKFETLVQDEMKNCK